MKKIIFISSLTVYLSLTVGFSVVHHFCGDYLINVSVNSADTYGEPESCCPGRCDDCCCKNEIKTIKLDDYQLSQVKWKLVSYGSEIILNEVENNFCLETNYYCTLKQNNSPPGNKTYLLNSTFRI